jgi:release factor glutamine methyltransferase
LVEAAAGIEPSQVPLLDSVDDSVRARALDFANRRATGEPLQYVLGIAGFRHLDLLVGPGVFIPRPETELVVEKAIERLPRGGLAVDIGAGAGSIALAIAGERPDATVYATELSGEAIAWMRRNLKKTGFKVELKRGDLFAPLPEEIRSRVDVVVSNPPYIPSEDAHLLPVEVAVHEPHQALYAGPTGLDVLARIVSEARSWLKPDGWLVMEIGDRQDKVVRALLQDADYSDVSIDKDLADRLRIASARNG